MGSVSKLSKSLYVRLERVRSWASSSIEFQTEVLHIIAVGPWAKCLMSLDLSLQFRRVGIIHLSWL